MKEATKRAFENKMLKMKRIVAVESFLWVWTRRMERIIVFVVTPIRSPISMFKPNQEVLPNAWN